MKTVAILGNASQTREYAPFDDEETDIWVMTLHALKARRVTAVLEMHDDVLISKRWQKYKDVNEYRQWLRTAKVPVYMHKKHPMIPSSRRYPREEIERKYGGGLWKGEQEIRTFFGGTASYGLPLALHLGYERIELYGIELARTHPEYAEERDALFLWIGRATALGIDVCVHEDSRLFSKMLYPMRG